MFSRSGRIAKYWNYIDHFNDRFAKNSLKQTWHKWSFSHTFIHQTSSDFVCIQFRWSLDRRRLCLQMFFLLLFIYIIVITLSVWISVFIISVTLCDQLIMVAYFYPYMQGKWGSICNKILLKCDILMSTCRYIILTCNLLHTNTIMYLSCMLTLKSCMLT